MINIIHKGSLSDSNSTTNPMGASIWYLVFICFGKIYCLWCMQTEVPSFGSSSVIYFTYWYLFYAKLHFTKIATEIAKSCSRCNKNTWHVESSYILPMSSLTLLEFTYNFGGLMQRRRSSMVNTLKSCLLCINPQSCYFLSCQHEVVLRTQHCSACSSFPGGLHASGQIWH